MGNPPEIQILFTLGPAIQFLVALIALAFDVRLLRFGFVLDDGALSVAASDARIDEHRYISVLFDGRMRGLFAFHACDPLPREDIAGLTHSVCLMAGQAAHA